MLRAKETHSVFTLLNKTSDVCFATFVTLATKCK